MGQLQVAVRAHCMHGLRSRAKAHRPDFRRSWSRGHFARESTPNPSFSTECSGCCRSRPTPDLTVSGTNRSSRHRVVGGMNGRYAVTFLRTPTWLPPIGIVGRLTVSCSGERTNATDPKGTSADACSKPYSRRSSLRPATPKASFFRCEAACPNQRPPEVVLLSQRRLQFRRC